VWDLKVVPVSNDHGLVKATHHTALHCRHCQFLVGANSHGNFLVVSIGPLGEVDSPRESHSQQHAPRCPTFASDSPENYGVESFLTGPPQSHPRFIFAGRADGSAGWRDRIWPRIDLSPRGFLKRFSPVGSESAEVFWAVPSADSVAPSPRPLLRDSRSRPQVSEPVDSE